LVNNPVACLIQSFDGRLHSETTPIHLMPSSRLLHLSDLHANDAWFRWAESVRKHYGLLVISGDLLNMNARLPMAEQALRVTHHLSALSRAPMALVSGNHDGVSGAGAELQDTRWMHSLRTGELRMDGDTFDHDGYLIRCFGWAEALPDSAGENEVWILHAPPEGATTAVSRDGVNFGDWNLGRICAEGRGPRVVLGGHVHDPLDWCSRVGRTWSLNPGYLEGESQPNYNVVDLVRGLATHHRAGEPSDIRRLWT
jgi:Icc-related predicted phosphoesterase